MTIRNSLLTEIAKRLVGILPDRTIRVAIDGVDGAGKTTFADELSSSVSALGRPVIRASVDSFHNPKAIRYRQGRHSPEGFFEDSYNYGALKTLLLDPLGPEGNLRCRTAFFDHTLDTEVPAVEVEVGPSSVLLIDGIFLHRPELLRYWDASIFLRADFSQSVARCATRDGGVPDPEAMSNRRYVEGQRLYLQRCRPANVGARSGVTAAARRPSATKRITFCCALHCSVPARMANNAQTMDFLMVPPKH